MREFKAMVMIDLTRILRSFLVPAMFVLIVFRMLTDGREEIFSYGFYVLVLAMVVFYADIDRDGGGKTFLLFDSLPLRRRTVMISHHLITSILLVLFEIMASVMLLVGSALGMPVDAGWPAVAAGVTGIMLAIFSVLIPVYIGCENSCAKVVFPVLVIFVVSGLLGFRAGMLSEPQDAWSQSFGAWFLGAMPWLLLLVGVAAWVASLFVSIRNYERQDH
ncbi:MAG: ABC-2 transporter permease [Propionibacterium sp.]|jgi:membrane protein|nr:ABC-2 transporter permease [Propionibacterium sp.]